MSEKNRSKASSAEILTPGFVRTEGVFLQYEQNCKLCNGPILKGEAKKLTTCDHVCKICHDHLAPVELNSDLRPSAEHCHPTSSQ